MVRSMPSTLLMNSSFRHIWGGRPEAMEQVVHPLPSHRSRPRYIMSLRGQTSQWS